MAENEQVKLLNSMIAQVLDGHLSYRVSKDEFDAEHAALYDNLCTLVDMYRQTIYRMQTAGSKITSASSDLSSTAEENGRIANELFETSERINGLSTRSAESTDKAIAGIRDMLARLEGIRSAAEETRGANAQAGTAIKSGREQVYNLISIISAIESTSRETVEAVEKFSESAGSIASILKNVNNIARQTEILSYNASIESKRAGEAGRGFGVIAGAIRDLASETKTEVTNIDEVVDGITQGLAELKERIYADSANVSKSVENTRTIESNLMHIDETYSQVSSLVDRITGMTNEQSEVASQVSQDISETETLSREATQGFGCVCRAVETQKQSLETLSGVVQFLIASSESLSSLTQSLVEESLAKVDVSGVSARITEKLKRDVLESPAFLSMTQEAHRRLLDQILKDGSIEAVWSNDAQGHFIYSNPPAGIANARVRDWFVESIKGRAFVSKPYISSITSRPCVTVTLPVPGPGGACIGVLGADIKVED